MASSELVSFAKIKVVGVGGGGTNAVSRMFGEVQGIQSIAMNTDSQALERVSADRKIHLGEKLTKGLGAGGQPSMGMRAAEETSDQIYEALKGADMVFITAGMGGGTGTGAAPVVAQIAREVGALTVGVVTRPFGFEGSRRKQNAEEGIRHLKDKVDTLIVVPNDRIMQIIEKKTTFEQAFRSVDDVLRQGIQGIAEVITIPGLINLDFADVKAIMGNAGTALMAIGQSRGEERAVEAAREAMASPLLDISVNGARGVMFNVTGGPDLTLFEVTEAAEVISKAVSPEANVIFGAVIDPNMSEDVKVTIIATGLETNKPVSVPVTPVGSASKAASAPRERVLTPWPEGTPEPEPVNLDIPAFLRRNN